MSKMYFSSLVLAGLGVGLSLASGLAGESRPVIQSIRSSGGNLIVTATVPSGFRQVTLQGSSGALGSAREALVTGRVGAFENDVTFTIPTPPGAALLVVEAREAVVEITPRFEGPQYFQDADRFPGLVEMSESHKISHVLNRLGYGPSPADQARIEAMGVNAYIDRQLHPEGIDEAGNEVLQRLEASLFTDYRPGRDTFLIQEGEDWRYFKGRARPPAGWRDTDFDDGGWFRGKTGIGMGDGDDRTVLKDMRKTKGHPGYVSVFMRKEFMVKDPAAIEGLIFRVVYDDGFVAYLNGEEIARANLEGHPPPFNARASKNIEPTWQELDVSDYKSLLRQGRNLLAIQLHNWKIDDGDASMIPALINRAFVPGAREKRIKGIDELQQLVHVRGIYSERQLQATLAEFWENHFTTDYDKTHTFLAELEDPEGNLALAADRSAAEAAQIEAAEYQFFYHHALGNFGDLLLFSATSPSQLIYLDNVLNRVGEPNENYARELLELFAFGVDNRYSQTDIEALARCFTGWQIRKVRPDDRRIFPQSAIQPPTRDSVDTVGSAIVEVGPGWTYFKGTREPSPYRRNRAGAWTKTDFDDGDWLTGATSIGAGDNDDATVLDDLRNHYTSVYLRRRFQVADPQELRGLELEVKYDDGFVAYLNGKEIARSKTMERTGNPPRFNATARAAHEVTKGVDRFNLDAFIRRIRPAPEENVLAIQVHNENIKSPDLSIHPRLIRRDLAPDSIDPGDPNGRWTFRFNPRDHDFGPKVIFAGTPYEIDIPGDRSGVEGVKDALEVIQAMPSHPSPSEFICVKLINKFVSDQISVRTFQDGSAPEPLRRLMEDAITAWRSTDPPGNIRTVLSAIFDPARRGNYFWTEAAFRAKVKTPIEFVNSMVRALDWEAKVASLPEATELMGMHLFTRDDPDGWSEKGFDWVSTGGFLERIKFASALPRYAQNAFLRRWSVRRFLAERNLVTAADIVDYFDHLLLQGTMPEITRNLFIQFANSNVQGNPSFFSPRRKDYLERAGDLIGLILAMPDAHYQ